MNGKYFKHVGRLALALGLAWLVSGAAPVKQPETQNTKESVPWAMAGYKLAEYYWGLEGHRELYEGQPLVITDLVSGAEVSRDGQWSLLLADNRIVVFPADAHDLQFNALRTFFDRESPGAGIRSKNYRNFFIKVTVRGVCAASPRAGKMELREAVVVAWYGVNVLKNGRILSFSIGEQFSAERVPYYQFLDWGQERQQFKGALLGIQKQGRRVVMTVERAQCFLGADPLALGAELTKISEICKANTVTKPLQLAIVGYPTDSSLRRFSDVRIVSWQVANPLLTLYEVVDNVGEVVDLKPPLVIEPPAPVVAAAEPTDAASSVKSKKPAVVENPDLKVVQALVAMATEALALQADDPKGRQYLRLAAHLLPTDPPVVELQGQLDRGEPLTAPPVKVSRFDLIDLVMARIATLSDGRNLHLPEHRGPCAFYVALARELEVGEDELAPVLMALQMYEQSTDLEEVSGIPSLRELSPDRQVAALASQVRGNDPAEVDRLLAEAVALKEKLGPHAPLATLINRLEQQRRYWNERVPCPACEGKGRLEASCRDCNGNGRLPCKRCQFTGQVMDRQVCPKCDGSGKRFGMLACKACDGIGTIEESATCPDCTGTGMIMCPRCRGTSKSSTPCEKCQGGGFRLRRDLPRPATSSDATPAVEPPATSPDAAAAVEPSAP